MGDMSEKEKHAQRVMGKQRANCGGWIQAPQSFVVPQPEYKPCECGNPQTALEKMFAGVPVKQYRPGGTW